MDQDTRQKMTHDIGNDVNKAALTISDYMIRIESSDINAEEKLMIRSHLMDIAKKMTEARSQLLKLQQDLGLLEQ